MAPPGGGGKVGPASARGRRAQPPPAAAWISEEGDILAIARQALRRALRRPAWVLGLSALAAAAFVASRLVRPPAYEAFVHFHLAEGEITDPTHAPRPPRAVREYVFNVALSRERVEEIMRKYRWSLRQLGRDPVAAVDEFRDGVNVEVGRNYFIYERRPSDPPRSAVVTVSLGGTDAEQTAATLHEIGQTIVDEQRTQRAERMEHARQLLEAELGRERASYRRLQETIGRLQADARVARGPEAIEVRTRIAAAQLEAAAAVERQVALERRATDVAFTAAAEGEQLGLRLDRVDEGLRIVRDRVRPFQLVRGALVVFVLAALLVVPVVGALDDRIYVPADLTVRGLPVVGALARFPGDDGGSYRARVPAKGV